MVMAASILALASVETPDAQAKQQCSAAIPSSNKHGYWSYRLIDGRKCWYEGKPMLSKDLLEWPKEANAREAKQEPKEALKREPRPESKSESRPESKAEIKSEPRPALKPEAKAEPRQALRQEAKQEARETLKEEDAFAPPAMRTKPDVKPDRVAETARNPLDAQAWAPQDGDTFEAIWRQRIQNQSLR
jgi:hypothetical protein